MQCIVCFEEICGKELKTSEFIELVVQQEEKGKASVFLFEGEGGEEEGKEEKKGYFSVGSTNVCKRMHLLCSGCALLFAKNAINRCCPSCRSPLSATLTLCHMLHVERERANYMAKNQQEIREVVDKYAENALSFCEKREKQFARRKEVDQCLCLEGFVTRTNDFTEDVRYKTRTPDANEMLCMMRSKRQ